MGKNYNNTVLFKD